MGILTNYTGDDVRVSEPHSQQGGNDLFQDVGPLESNENLLEEAKDQADDLHVTLVPFEQSPHFGEDDSVQLLVFYEIRHVLRSNQRRGLKI